MFEKTHQSLHMETTELSGRENQVESIPVGMSKKLSQRVPQLVGDFSLIPTSWIDRVQLIGSVHEGIREKGIHTKSANKGWRVVAKW